MGFNYKMKLFSTYLIFELKNISIMSVLCRSYTNLEIVEKSNFLEFS